MLGILIQVHPERITQGDKKLANDINNGRVEFPVREKDFSKIKKKEPYLH